MAESIALLDALGPADPDTLAEALAALDAEGPEALPDGGEVGD